MKVIQQVAGTFLYHGYAVDSTMLVAISAVITQQANPKQATMDKVMQFLNYCTSQENAIITYKKSDRQLVVDSDVGYIHKKNAKSHVGGHHFLTNYGTDPHTQ